MARKEGVGVARFKVRQVDIIRAELPSERAKAVIPDKDAIKEGIKGKKPKGR